jgi:hypothetical protein
LAGNYHRRTQKTSETHPHAAAATRRTYRWLLGPILPLIERGKNFREAWFALIVKRVARLIGALVEFARFPVRQLKGGVDADVLVVRLWEMIVLVLVVGRRADEVLHRRLPQQ